MSGSDIGESLNKMCTVTLLTLYTRNTAVGIRCQNFCKQHAWSQGACATPACAAPTTPTPPGNIYYTF